MEADPGPDRPLLPWQVAWEMENLALARKRDSLAMGRDMRQRNPFSAGALLQAIMEADEPAQPTRSAAEWLTAGEAEMITVEEDLTTGEETLDTLELASARTDSGVHQRVSQEFVENAIPDGQHGLEEEEVINIPNERPWREVEPEPPVDNSVWV